MFFFNNLNFPKIPTSSNSNTYIESDNFNGSSNLLAKPRFLSATAGNQDKKKYIKFVKKKYTYQLLLVYNNNLAEKLSTMVLHKGCKQHNFKNADVILSRLYNYVNDRVFLIWRFVANSFFFRSIFFFRFIRFKEFLFNMSLSKRSALPNYNRHSRAQFGAIVTANQDCVVNGLQSDIDVYRQQNRLFFIFELLFRVYTDFFFFLNYTVSKRLSNFLSLSLKNSIYSVSLRSNNNIMVAAVNGSFKDFKLFQAFCCFSTVSVWSDFRLITPAANRHGSVARRWCRHLSLFFTLWSLTIKHDSLVWLFFQAINKPEVKKYLVMFAKLERGYFKLKKGLFTRSIGGFKSINRFTSLRNLKSVNVWVFANSLGFSIFNQFLLGLLSSAPSGFLKSNNLSFSRSGVVYAILKKKIPWKKGVLMAEESNTNSAISEINLFTDYRHYTPRYQYELRIVKIYFEVPVTVIFLDILEFFIPLFRFTLHSYKTFSKYSFDYTFKNFDMVTGTFSAFLFLFQNLRHDLRSLKKKDAILDAVFSSLCQLLVKKHPLFYRMTEIDVKATAGGSPYAHFRW